MKPKLIKCLIFIGLKVGELGGPALFIYLYCLFLSSLKQISHPTKITYYISMFLELILLYILIRLLIIAIPGFIKLNKEWTNKIYEKLKK